MVRGIDKFREFFTGYEGNYVIIGGTACEMHEEIYAGMNITGSRNREIRISRIR